MRTRIAVSAAVLAASLLAGCNGPSSSALAPQTAIQSLQRLSPNGCGWTIVNAPNPGYGNRLNGVAGSSASDVWSVGKYASSSQGPLTLAVHWDGTAWTQATTPNPGAAGDALVAVATLSVKDAWAVGRQISSASQTSPLILHYNGTAWKGVATPQTSGFAVLDSIAAVSATNIWAIGYAYNYGSSKYEPYGLHYNGKKWSMASLANSGSFGSVPSAVAASAANDVWVTGGTASDASADNFVTFTEHWNGSKWSVIKSPNANKNDNLFNAAAAVSSKDVWAIGDYYTGTTFATLTEHWDGSAWKIVKSPNVKGRGNGLYGATALSSKDVWAVGSAFVGSSQSSTLALHWNGTQWSISKTPNNGNDQLDAAAAIPNTKQIDAVGTTLSNGAANQTLVERNACGV